MVKGRVPIADRLGPWSKLGNILPFLPRWTCRNVSGLVITRFSDGVILVWNTQGDFSFFHIAFANSLTVNWYSGFIKAFI